MSSQKFFVGVDFGTFKTAIVASNSRRETLPTAVGQPKDHVARSILGQEFVFGEEIFEDELALEVVRPFAKGALKYVPQSEAGISNENGDRCREAARLILQHAVSLVEPPAGVPVYAVIGAPSRATAVSKQMLIEAAQGAFEALAIVAEPFLVAYSTKRLRKTLVVDIGAGTIDICPVYGIYPREEDQVTLPIGGDLIDEDFHRRLQQAHPDVQVTVDMAREIKERHGFVHDVNESAIVTLPVDGVPTTFDVTDILKESCKSIVKPIVEGIHEVIAQVHPKLQQTLLENVLLGGGGSQLRGLDGLIEQGLDPLGGGRVTKVYDSVFAGAVGALGLAMAMPPSAWNTLSEARSAMPTDESLAKAA
jgi:rod shape-determining protein MreB